MMGQYSTGSCNKLLLSLLIYSEWPAINEQDVNRYKPLLIHARGMGVEISDVEIE